MKSLAPTHLPYLEFISNSRSGQDFYFRYTGKAQIVKGKKLEANSIDADKTAPEEHSYQGLHCLPLSDKFCTASSSHGGLKSSLGGLVQIQKCSSRLQNLVGR